MAPKTGYSRPDGAEIHEIWAQRAKRAQELYEAGVPFYTKQALRDLDQHLQGIRQKEPGVYKVTLMDFEGNPVTSRVSVGWCEPLSNADEDLEAIETFQYLTPHFVTVVVSERRIRLIAFAHTR